MKKKMLGKTGIAVSEAGFGVLPMGPSQLALPVETGAAILRYALERGINFLDTAQYYRTYPYIAAALRNGSFPDVVICSKSLCWDYAGMMDAVEEARVSLERDVIEIFLLQTHCSCLVGNSLDKEVSVCGSRACGTGDCSYLVLGHYHHLAHLGEKTAYVGELFIVDPYVSA